MYIGSLSRRYAKALLAYATENGHGEQVYREAITLAYCLTDVSLLRKAIGSPVLPMRTKIQLACEAVAHPASVNVEHPFPRRKDAANELSSLAEQNRSDSSQVSAELKRFLWLVMKEHREAYLAFMFLSYIDLYQKQQHISVGTLTTASTVSPALLERIRSLIADETHGTVELRTTVDPSLLGGFRLEIGTYRLDASMAHQLERVKKQFVARNRRIV